MIFISLGVPVHMIEMQYGKLNPSGGNGPQAGKHPDDEQSGHAPQTLTKATRTVHQNFR